MIPGVTSRADLEDMLNRIFGGGAGGGGTGASDEVIKNIEEQGRNAKRDLRAQADKDKESLMANFASRGILSSGLARGAEIDLLSGLYRALGGVDTDIMRAVADARLRQEQFDRTQGLAERQADWGLLKDFFNWLGVTPSQGGAAAPTSQNAASPYYVYPGTERQVSYPQGVTARSAPAAALPTPTPAAAPQRTSDPRLVRNESPFGGWRETGRVERGVNEPTSLIGTALSKMKESQWLRLQRLAEDINNERLSRGQPPLSTTDIMERVWIDQGTRAFPRTPNTTTAAGGRTPDEALTMGAKALRTLAAPFLDVLRAFSPYPKPLDPNANPLMPGA